MPTNVSVEYALAEKKYQEASTVSEQLKGLEEMLRLAPAHKGGEKLRAEIKTKIAKLREKLQKEAQQKKSGGASLAVKKEGAAQVVLVGPSNTGKSSLLNTLTRAQSPVSHYPFTTTKPELGVLDFETVLIQLVDLPPLLEEAAVKQAALFAVIRNADLVVLVVEKLEQIKPLLKEFNDSNIILNKARPPIQIKREISGGLIFIGEKLIEAEVEDVKKLLMDNEVKNATIEVFAPVGLEDFFQVLDEKLVFLPAFVVWNKQDQQQEKDKVMRNGAWEIVPFSTVTKINLDFLKRKIWEHLGLVRVYTKEPGKSAKKERPITLKKGSTIENMAEYIHKDFLKKFNYARIWGSSAKHNGQTVGIEHSLADKDIVEIHLK